MHALDSIGAVYALLGLALSAAGIVLALSRGRAARSFYATDVYHMTSRTHRRFALVSAACALGFIAALRWTAIGIPLLGGYTLLIVLYASSFARGFTGDDE